MGREPVSSPSDGGAADRPKAEPEVSVAGLGDAWVIVELAPDAIMVVDEHGHILLANRAAETMFGYNRETLVSLGVDALVPDGRRHAHHGHRSAYDTSPRTRPMRPDLELWARRADGSEFPVEISLSPIALGDSARVVAIVRDMTAYRANEQAIRERLVLADEDRIGAELRDGVISKLFSAGMGVHAVMDRVEPEVGQRLLEVAAQLDLAIREIRNSVFRPALEPDHSIVVDEPG
jgi:PAS domain S-box-containing protein